jgi:Fe-Mn family superoxide dismutase
MQSSFPRNQTMNKYGGGPPPGFGAHPREKEMWQQPRFRKHPLTNKMEAVGGLFHRLWPEHVDMLRKMKEDGWPHKDIIDVAEELFQRQQEDFQQKLMAIQELKQQRDMTLQQDIQGAMDFGPPAPEDMQQEGMGMPGEEGGEEGQEMAKGAMKYLSLLSKGPYESLLSFYRRRHQGKGVNHGFNIISKSKRDAFSLPELKYSFDALKPYLDEGTMRLHYKVHHKKYLEKLNDALRNTVWVDCTMEEILYNIMSLPEDIRDMVAFHGGGYINHCLFFDILCPHDKQRAPDNISFLKHVEKAFGSFAKLKDLITDVALGIQGVGWAWLVVDKDGSLLVVKTANQDSPLMNGDTPILGIDMWEHAYYKKYGPKREKYLENIWKVMDWQRVQELYFEAMANCLHKAGEGAGGIRPLTPKEEKTWKDQSFSRRQIGVSNAGISGAEDRDAEAKRKRREEEEKEMELEEEKARGL